MDGSYAYNNKLVLTDYVHSQTSQKHKRCYWVAWPVFRFNLIKNIWWDLKKAVATWNPKIISDLKYFFKWGMGQDTSREIINYKINNYDELMNK